MSGNLVRARRAVRASSRGFRGRPHFAPDGREPDLRHRAQKHHRGRICPHPSAYYHLVTERDAVDPATSAALQIARRIAASVHSTPRVRAGARSILRPVRRRHEWDYVMRFWRIIGPTSTRFVLLGAHADDCSHARAGSAHLRFRPGFVRTIARRSWPLLFRGRANVLAHGRVVQTDIPAAFGLLLSIFALYRYWQVPTWRSAARRGRGRGDRHARQVFDGRAWAGSCSLFFLVFLSLAAQRSAAHTRRTCARSRLLALIARRSTPVTSSTIGP